MPEVVLVTGCTKGGIGFYLCEAFAEKGCTVYATSRKIESMDGFSHEGIHRLALDVTSDKDVQDAVDTVIQAEGKIDILVNNAGVICIGPLIDVPMERVQQTFDANTFGALRTARTVIPHMAARKKGMIVNVGSIVGEVPTPWNGIYSATKAALHSLTQVLEMECRPLNISVMLVAPGSVKSNLVDNHSKIFSLPPTSLYGSFIDQIIRRMHVSQTGDCMPTDYFAQQVVSKIMRRNPPFYVRIGGNIRGVSILEWLPRGLVLWIVWRVFSRK